MNSHLNRRDFLQQSSSMAVGGGLLGSLTLSSMAEAVQVSKQIPIVDTHHHLWDLKKFDLPWTNGEGLETLKRSFVMEDYLEATRNLNIVKSVYMEVDVHPSQQDKEAEYVLDIIKEGKTPMVAAVISGRPGLAGFREYITKYEDQPLIKGVRQVLHGDSTPAGYCLHSQFVKSVQLLGEMGKSFDLCMRPGEIVDGAKLVKQCPKTRFIVDHCGNMGVQETDKELRAKWEVGMKELAQQENVVCKISGLIASAKPREWKAEDLAPNMNFSMETFGPDRIMFGGDWPVCTLTATYRQWVDALKTIVQNKSDEEKKKLFHDNAVKFYGLA